MMYGIVVHGGAGGTSSRVERGCRLAAEVGMKILRRGESALDAVVAVVVRMENSGIFNAGVGAILRIDGQNIEMDAAIATSGGVQGAVGAVRDIKNPILLACRLAESPEFRIRFLVGEGATDLGRRLGLKPHPGPNAKTRKNWKSMMDAIRRGKLTAPPLGWTAEELEQQWSSGEEAQELVPAAEHDTVGAVALDVNGVFAVASSTGGSGVMPIGRVGDVPENGSGFRVGHRGGVLATGVGEEIMARRGSDAVYSRILGGRLPQDACQLVVDNFPLDVPVGFVALTRKGVGAASNCSMAFYPITEE